MGYSNTKYIPLPSCLADSDLNNELKLRKAYNAEAFVKQVWVQDFDLEEMIGMSSRDVDGFHINKQCYNKEDLEKISYKLNKQIYFADTFQKMMHLYCLDLDRELAADEKRRSDSALLSVASLIWPNVKKARPIEEKALSMKFYREKYKNTKRSTILPKTFPILSVEEINEKSKDAYKLFAKVSEELNETLEKHGLCLEDSTLALYATN